jgi:hypothetical protein
VGDAGDAAAAEPPACELGCPSSPCSADDWCSVDTPKPAFELGSLWGSSANDVWAAGAGGALWHWDGIWWEETPTGTDRRFHGVWGAHERDVWAVSSGAVLRHCDGWRDGAPIWTAEHGGWRAPVHAIWASGPGDLWIVGPTMRSDRPPPLGNVPVPSAWHSEGMVDGKAPWRASDPGPFSFNAVWGSGPNDVWIAGEEGKLRHSRGWTEAGAGWEAVPTPSVATYYGIWGSGPNDVWIVGAAGVILHGSPEDGRLRFARVESPTTQNLHGIWGSAPDDIWVVGDGGTALHYDGQRWAISPTAPEGGHHGPLFAVWGSGPDDVWIVGRDVILRRERAHKETQ